MFFLTCYFGICSLIAQNIDATTMTGQKVVLSPNGTWHYDSIRTSSLYKGKDNKETNTIVKEKPKLNNNTLAKDTLYSFRKFFRDYKNCCILNERDSTCAGNTDWADKTPKLNMVDGQQLEIVKYIYQTFNKTACSKDYNFKIVVIFKVNCRGEIYDVKFINNTDFLTEAQYCLDEFYKFSNGVFESMQKIDKVGMTPPQYFDRGKIDTHFQGMSYTDFQITYSNNKETGSLFVNCKEKNFNRH